MCITAEFEACCVSARCLVDEYCGLYWAHVCALLRCAFLWQHVTGRYVYRLLLCWRESILRALNCVAESALQLSVVLATAVLGACATVMGHGYTAP